jgi:hypothetical protein
VDGLGVAAVSGIIAGLIGTPITGVIVALLTLDYINGFEDAVFEAAAHLAPRVTSQLLEGFLFRSITAIPIVYHVFLTLPTSDGGVEMVLETVTDCSSCPFRNLLVLCRDIS